MALQIRRGTNAERLTITPSAGELLYTTDTKKLYVGDGSTVGGVAADSIDIVNDTSPQLGGNLEVNGFSIVSAGDGDININPAGNGNVVLQTSLEITPTGSIIKTGELNISPSTFTSFGRNDTLVDGNVYITRNTYAGTLTAGFTYAQHHNTADAVNFSFYRTRGTGTAPTSVQNGDDLADIAFIGWDGTQRLASATITASVDGVVSTGIIPGKLQFLLHDGVTSGTGGFKLRAEINAAGVFKTDSIQNLSGSQLSLTATTIAANGNLELNAQGDLRFRDSDSSNWVAFQAPATIASNVTWTLPATDGSSGQVLSTNGLGTLSWASPPGFATRTTVNDTTSSIVDGAIDNLTLTGYIGYVLYKVQTSHAARVRIYTDISSRTADASRAEGVDPTLGSGVIADIVTTGAQTIVVSPGIYGFNNETIPANEIYVAVTNKSGSPASITVTLTIVQSEA